MNNQEIVFRLPVRDRNCTLLQNVQVSSGVHRTSYSVAIGGFFFTEDKPARPEAKHSIPYLY